MKPLLSKVFNLLTKNAELDTLSRKPKFPITNIPSNQNSNIFNRSAAEYKHKTKSFVLSQTYR